MTGRAHKLLEDALTLPDDERLDLAEQLLSSLPSDSEWLAELERRARRVLATVIPTVERPGMSWNDGLRLALRADDEVHPHRCGG